MTFRADPELRVLVVDDERFIRDIVVRMLHDMGYLVVQEAGDGSAAIDISKTLSPGLIVCDINMKPMNGLQFLQKVRAGSAGISRNTPVILLTGVSDEDTVGHALALDVNAFLVKPVSRTQFEKKIERVMAIPIRPQPIEFYETIEVPVAAGSGAKPEAEAPQPSAEGAAAPAAAESEAGGKKPPGVQSEAVQRFFRELVPYSQLAENLVSAQGTLIVGMGTFLDEGMIEKLKDIKDLCATDQVWVIEPEAPRGGGDGEQAEGAAR